MKNVLCAENPELPMASASEAGVGQSIALHALPADRNCPFPFSAFLVYSSSFFLALFKPEVTHITNRESAFPLRWDELVFCSDKLSPQLIGH